MHTYLFNFWGSVFPRREHNTWCQNKTTRLAFFSSFSALTQSEQLAQHQFAQLWVDLPCLALSSLETLLPQVSGATVVDVNKFWLIYLRGHTRRFEWILMNLFLIIHYQSTDEGNLQLSWNFNIDRYLHFFWLIIKKYSLLKCMKL